jgi:hypothetical protein
MRLTQGISTGDQYMNIHDSHEAESLYADVESCIEKSDDIISID